MTISLQKSSIHNTNSLTITGSKSESNRLLLLQALFPELTIENVSNSDDSHVMQQALETTSEIIDIHHAGTAMRFLTAYFASKAGNEVVLTGSPRMKERPIKILVEALTHLGADIAYLESEACPPLRIKGKHLTQSKVSLNANVSSQYISALMLIAAKLENGLELTLEGKITSVPYIEMTLALLKQVGIEASFNGNVIKIVPQVSTLNPQTLVVESDWSSASYFYSIVALSAVGTNIRLSSYKKDSLQGDSVLASLYESFGVSTVFENEQIQIKKVSEAIKEPINFQLNHAPDIAQTIAVTCLGLGISCHLSGLHTLKIKETDRLLALKTEIEKLGGSVHITENSLALEVTKHINFDVSIATYNDHRMAMAFAPMALKTKLNIEDANVVSKSHPSFWDDLKNLGFKITQ